MPAIRDLQENLASEIAELQDKSLKLLKLDRNDDPKKIVEAIKLYIEQISDLDRNVDEDDVAGLAVLLAEQYVREFKWHWREVNFKDDYSEDHYVPSILNADNSLAIAPIWWIYDIIEGKSSNGVLLNFNLVAANRVPIADPNSALILH